MLHGMMDMVLSIHGVKVNAQFLDTPNDYGMEQLVSDSTRNEHILDLVLTTQPEMLKGVTIVPGISDH